MWGDHSIQNCEAEAPKCPNCDGNHAAGFYGCERFVQAKRVQFVKEQSKVSYAEAVQRVAREHGNGKPRDEMVIGSQGIESNLSSALSSDLLVFNKESFLSFISDVLVGAKKAVNRSDVIRVVVDAAERYFNIKQVPAKLHQFMTESQHKERSQLLRASSMEDVNGEEDLYPR